MTKRKYPWPSDFCFQLKSHIGLLEVVNGVNGRVYMKDIEDHTNSLLTEGAKKFYSNIPTEHCLTLKNEVIAMDSSQKTITSFFISNGQNKSSIPSIYAGCNGVCQSCEYQGLECQYCNKKTCSPCGQTCSVCHQYFCSTCSVKRYDLDHEAAICFECIT